MVAIVAAPESAWEMLQYTAETLDGFGVGWRKAVFEAPHDEAAIKAAIGQCAAEGIKIIVVGGADSRAAALVANCSTLPTLAVPLAGKAVSAAESQQRLKAEAANSPLAMLAIGKAGAINAALLAVAILAPGDTALSKKLADFRAEQTAKVEADSLF